MYFDYRRSADPQVGFATEEEAAEWQEYMFVNELTAMLHDVEQAWRCQLGSELFAACVDCARAGHMSHELFALLDNDMVAYTGDDRWHHNAAPLAYGPDLPYGHPIKRQEVDDELPF